MAELIFQQDAPSLLNSLPPLQNAIFVVPTDTLYGLSCLQVSQAGQQRIRQLKRSENDKFIVLVPSLEAADQLAEITNNQRATLKYYWPAPISFIFPRKNGEGTIALRLPQSTFLQQWMQKSGPIISTSCNRHGETPINNIREAVEFFSDRVDFYIDGGTLLKKIPSTLVDMTLPTPSVLRTGAIPFTPIDKLNI